jgi:hypothetical protein
LVRERGGGDPCPVGRTSTWEAFFGALVLVNISIATLVLDRIFATGRLLIQFIWDRR